LILLLVLKNRYTNVILLWSIRLIGSLWITWIFITKIWLSEIIRILCWLGMALCIISLNIFYRACLEKLEPIFPMLKLLFRSLTLNFKSFSWIFGGRLVICIVYWKRLGVLRQIKGAFGLLLILIMLEDTMIREISLRRFLRRKLKVGGIYWLIVLCANLSYYGFFVGTAQNTLLSV
jgi:hypothetical protein